MCLAIPGKVEEITTEGDLRIGRVNFGGIVKRVCLDYVPEVQVGDYTIVHVGFALSKIDEETALADAGGLPRDGRAGRGVGQRGRGLCAGGSGAAVAVSGWKLLSGSPEKRCPLRFWSPTLPHRTRKDGAHDCRRIEVYSFLRLRNKFCNRFTNTQIQYED